MSIKLNKKTYITSGIITIALIFSCLFIFLKPSAKAVDGFKKGSFISVQKALIKEYAPIVPVTVTARSRRSTNISAFVSARVQEIHFKVGQKVKKSQLLLTLEPDLYDIDLDKQSANVELTEVKLESNEQQCILYKDLFEQSQALYKLAQSNYDRYALLHKKTYGSKADVDLADEKVLNVRLSMNQRSFDVKNCALTSKSLRAELKQAKANERLAKKNLFETKIYAPYNGIITDQLVSVGRTVSVGQELFSLYDSSRVELEGVLSDKTYLQIENMNGILKACASMSDNTDCYVLERVSQNMSNLGIGHVGFFSPTGKNNFVQGETATLYLRLPKINSYAVPAAAIYNQDTIFLVKDGVLTDKKVKIMGKWVNPAGKLYRLINKSTLKPESVVMITYLPGARSGQKVNYSKIAAKP